MTRKRKQDGWLTHLFFITLFLIVPTLAFVRRPNEPFFAFTRVFVQDTVANCVLLVFFYLNYYILIPKVFYRRQYVRYIVFVILFLSLGMALPHWVGTHLPDDVPDLPASGFYQPHGPPFHRPFSLLTFEFDEFRRHLFLFFAAVFFSFLLRTREHLSQLKEEKANAELSLLRSQINPHFLFNTLNSIYVLSVKKDDRTSSAIINLSGLMRYVIKDAHDHRISLQKELDYLDNYIQLQKARLGDTTQIRFTCSGNPGNHEIAPLLLITYIENAFKYGVNPDADDCRVDIAIGVDEHRLTMTVFNNKISLAQRIESTGIGIANTTERLRLLYPGKHKVEVREDDKTYLVTLTLDWV